MIDTENTEKMQEEFDKKREAVIRSLVNWEGRLLFMELPYGDARKEVYMKRLEDPNFKEGNACKEFVCIGRKLGKDEEVEKELHRLLSITANLCKWDLIKEPVDDIVKRLMDMYSPDTDSAEKVSVSQNEGNALVEIQHLKHLMDIMERNIQGKMTEQDAIELKEIGNKDIEKLKQMVGTLNN